MEKDTEILKANFFINLTLTFTKENKQNPKFRLEKDLEILLRKGVSNG